jgi:hypothetical protein
MIVTSTWIRGRAARGTALDWKTSDNRCVLDPSSITLTTLIDGSLTEVAVQQSAIAQSPPQSICASARDKSLCAVV